MDAVNLDRPAGRIAVIEDDIALRNLVIRILRMESYEVVGFSTAAETLERIAAEDPDVLILDLELPDLDGETLLATLREQGYTQPVILMTASPNAMGAFRRMNADGLLTKPFDPFTLLSLLHSLVASQKLAGEF